MNRLGDLVSQLRVSIKATSDDSLYSDEYLYNTLRYIRNRLIANERGAVSPFNWQTVCIPLSKTKYHDCDCVDVGCDVLKTSQEIPTVVVKNSKPLIRVRTFDGHVLHYVTPNRQKHNKHSETLSDAPAYYIQNGKLIVWNTFDFKAIMVEGVFEDPTELSNISICNSDGDVYSQCTYDVNAQPFPINDKLLDRMMSEALRRILGIFNVPNDIVNEGNSNV